jgi:hypothetical protein
MLIIYMSKRSSNVSAILPDESGNTEDLFQFYNENLGELIPRKTVYWLTVKARTQSESLSNI